MVFWGRWGARTHVECHDGQPSAAGSHPSPIVISPLWQTDGKTIEKNGSAEKWRKCGIVGNCLRWLRSWGLGKSVAERRAADKKQHTATHYMGSQPLQCTIWDQEFFWKWWGSESFNSFEDWGKAWRRDEPLIKSSALQSGTIWESFGNDEAEIQRHAKTKTNTKTRDADKKPRRTAMHYMGPGLLRKWWGSKSFYGFEIIMHCVLQKVANWS